MPSLAADSELATGDLTFGRTWSFIRADLRRRLALEGRTATLANALRIVFKPGVVCVVGYRLANHLYKRNHRVLARILDDFLILYTGIEIQLGSSIGPGLVFADRPGGGIAEHVKLGSNCTILGGATIVFKAEGVDLSQGAIVIGDYCVIGAGSRIIGAIRLADGTQVKPNSVVVMSSPTIGAILEGCPARKKGQVPLEALARWNPLKSILMPGLECDPSGQSASGAP